MKKLLLLLIVGASLSSCSLTQERPETARLLTHAATYKIIDDDTNRAVRVIEIASEVRSIAQSDPDLTIAATIASTRSLIRWEKLDQAERLLVEAVLSEVKIRLEDRFGTNPLPEDLRLTVNAICTWVIEAAAISGGVPE